MSHFFTSHKMNQHLFWIFFLNIKLFKKNECNVCHEIFRQETLFIEHIQRAHNQNLKCAICKRKFSTNTVLKRHVNSVHLKLKPHKCSDCSYSSYFKSNVKNHAENMHSKSSSLCKNVSLFWFIKLNCIELIIFVGKG